MIDLRDLGQEDSERLYDWRRSPEVDRWMCGERPDAPEAHRRWFEGFLASRDKKGWIITYRGSPCGFLALSGVAGCNRRAEWGWYIGEAEARGRGVGRAAQALGLDRAFDDLGLEKVWAEVLAHNDAALKAQVSAGFRREGYLRRHALKDGEFHDVVLLAMLRDEWRDKREAVRRKLAASNLLAA
ncbi:MAG TPA: UDP-4-amino-4,6-dideoxy-N-acetyl-beta-L-altrosamine N-acetyltransferase [Caulobacteraceae bacterium]|jgi:UDP-4-amino-4,6-dideoxy-N-acetyl-beta-L-altrosamine N-acetyltransferase